MKWMPWASLLFPLSASASGVLFSDTGYLDMDNIDIEVVIEGRIATVTTQYQTYAELAEELAFAADLPEGAIVVDLRYYDGNAWVDATLDSNAHIDEVSGPDGGANSLFEGESISVDLPNGVGEVVVELSWQQILVMTDDELQITIPVDDQGLNPTAPEVTIDVVATMGEEIVEASFEPGTEVDFDKRQLSVSWSGPASETDSAILTWTEEPAPFGIMLLPYLPGFDPFTGHVDDGYALVFIQPGSFEKEARVSQLFTFVLDTSSSMSGAPLEAAVDAASSWLDSLEPEDRFNVVPYASQAIPFRGHAPKATDKAVERAKKFLERQQAMGLSDPEDGLTTALALANDTVQQNSFFACNGSIRHDDDAPPAKGQPIVTEEGEEVRVAPYVVFLTDGGASTGTLDTNSIAASVSKANTVGASIYAIGVGEGVDQQLLSRITSDHRGEVRLAQSVDDIPDIVAELNDEISDPMLVQPVVDAPGTHDYAPSRLPDVNAGREVLLAFRYDTPGTVEISLSGIRGQDDVDKTYEVLLPERETQYPAIALAWAQLRVEELDATYAGGDTSVYNELYELVTTYGVASNYVSYQFGDDRDDSYPEAAMAMDMEKAAGCGCALSPWALAGWMPCLTALLAASIRRRRREAV
ncbi:MAG: VWA domain-containing protein [Proteobacteria bacterium]|jgi:hypothetical protein|nr:VWA domain-containing protein [Pseudomonadota bacterium]